MFDRFIFVAALACGIAMAGTVVNVHRGASFVAVLKVATVAAAVLAPLLGVFVGSFHSHGFDIPWWAFGAIISLLILLSVLVAGGAATLWKRHRQHGS